MKRIIIVTVMLLGACTGSPDTEIVVANKLPGLKFLSLSDEFHTEDNRYEIQARVCNNGKTLFTDLDLQADLLDADGKHMAYTHDGPGEGMSPGDTVTVFIEWVTDAAHLPHKVLLTAKDAGGE